MHDFMTNKYFINLTVILFPLIFLILSCASNITVPTDESELFNEALKEIEEKTPKRMAVLPFSGADMSFNGGKIIADHFSIDEFKKASYSIVNYNSYNVDYVLSGKLCRIGETNLVISTIINVKTYELTAWDCREYKEEYEILEFVPKITEKLIHDTKRNIYGLPHISVIPFIRAEDYITRENAGLLAEILSLKLADTGKYKVFTSNVDYELSVEVRKNGDNQILTARIYDKDKNPVKNENIEYNYEKFSIDYMEYLALLLTDSNDALKLKNKIDRNEKNEKTKEKREESKEIFKENFIESLFDEERYWSIGATIGTSFSTPGLIATVYTTFSLVKYTFIELGCDFGGLSTIEDVHHFSFYPFVHFAGFLPFISNMNYYYYSNRNNSNLFHGIGVGWMKGNYYYPLDIKVPVSIIAMDWITGINLGYIRISHTLRTNFKSVNNKLSIGGVYYFH